MTRYECSVELRAKDYNHTDSNRYAKVTGGGLLWARVLPDGEGDAYRIEYQTPKARTKRVA